MNKKIKFRVNGKKVELEVPTNRLLIDCLRYDLGLTGTKEGCSVGVCGACTVLMDGAMVSSCLELAVFADGHDITTVEGLAKLPKVRIPVMYTTDLYHRRRAGQKRRAASGAEKLHPVRWLPVRYLHTGPGRGGQGAFG